jgi:ribonuclease HI
MDLGEPEEEEEDPELGKPDGDRRASWATVRDNLWDSPDEATLKAVLADMKANREPIGGKCARDKYLKVWEATCGGVWFMRKGMRPYWLDDGSTMRLSLSKVVKEYEFTDEQEAAFQEGLSKEIREGIVKEVDRSEIKFLNPVFMVDKKTTEKGKKKKRKVMDCRWLNAEQRHIHFRMDGPEVVQDVALEGDFATSLDVDTAFPHMLVSEEYQPYLGFTHRGKFYVYVGMPFGARHSPRIFTRALSYGIAYVRVHWRVRVIAYMDDVLILHQDREYLRLATLQIAVFLSSLGWTLSAEKCELEPAHEIVYLGWKWRFDTLCITMTSSMRKSLLYLLTQWTRKVTSGARVAWKKLGALIGSLNFLRVQFPRASLYLKALHTELTAGVKKAGWFGWGVVSRRVISELRFWWRQVHYNTPFGFARRIPRALLVTDASEHGWGAVLYLAGRHYLAFGSFSTEFDFASSNRRETTAILKALLYWKTMLQELGGHAISIKTDNMVTVFNLQRQGASEGLLYETRQIFSLLLKLDVRVAVTHIPGVKNATADALSRLDRAGDYELKTEMYRRGTQFLNVNPEVDLFATDANHKCQRYLALPGVMGRGACAWDALRFSWAGGRMYAFPPVQILPRVLQKIRAERAEVILVAPEWPSRPWWNLFQDGVVQQVRLGRSEEVLIPGPTLAKNGTKPPPGDLIMARVCYVW